MKQIVFFRSQGNWMAKLINDPETTKLMGTSIIPTAFKDTMPPWDINDILGPNWPDHKVRIQP